ncbi:hypothetical protein NLJ89_g4320 [Agrocybe chaxingu]|uniref:Uncharacterized protein n=1 Tax=Agrocybe chaxingu TaxID=84603 RepID=A0A9W8K325_9AGAR|nr:hypothetical protein NLJ89_g4320 [Agrocybe chaxingu]
MGCYATKRDWKENYLKFITGVTSLTLDYCSRFFFSPDNLPVNLKNLKVVGNEVTSPNQTTSPSRDSSPILSRPSPFIALHPNDLDEWIEYTQRLDWLPTLKSITIRTDALKTSGSSPNTMDVKPPRGAAFETKIGTVYDALKKRSPPVEIVA